MFLCPCFDIQIVITTQRKVGIRVKKTMSKAHIPPETTFALATQCEENVHKQAEIDMANAKVPNANRNYMYIPRAHVGSRRVSRLGLGGFLDTNLLVSASQKSRIRAITPT